MCTSLIIKDADGVAHVGRTMELTSEEAWHMYYLPAGHAATSLAPAGGPGLSYGSDHPVLGIGTPLHDGLNNWFVQGFNDKGVVGCVQAFGDTTSPEVPEGSSSALAASDLLAWGLGTCASVEELKGALAEVDLWVPGIPTLTAPPAAYHYGFFDRTGAGIVVEFYDQTVHIWDNPVGALTNGPEFGWHLKNLTNYTFISNVDKNQQSFRDFSAVSQDNGIALSGLPAANTSQSRFVKAAYYSNFSHSPKAGTDPLIQLGHMMNNFDRPYGLTNDPAGSAGDGGVSSTSSTEWTIWSTLHDLTGNRMQVRTDGQLNWMEFDHAGLTAASGPIFIALADLEGAADPMATLVGG